MLYSSNSKWKTYALAFLFVALVAVPFGRAQEEKASAEALSHAFRFAVHQVLPSVVSISAEKEAKKMDEEDLSEIPEIFRRFIPKEYWEEHMNPSSSWQGSGVIISSSGEVLTNYHVVNGADQLEVQLDDGSLLDAEVVASDPYTDIALIQLKGDGPFAYCQLGDSDVMQVGDWVLAIGNPFGLNQSVSEGIVSAKGRTGADVPVGINDNFLFKDFIQTTAAINPGNSGGPLINLDGEVIGVNDAIQTAGVPANLGIGFAIPSNMAKRVIGDLKKFDKVRRGYLGVILNFNPDVMEHFKDNFGITNGSLITEVLDDTPASKAGLQHGDLILEVDGKKVRDSSHLQTMIVQYPVDAAVELTVFRGKEKIKKTVLLTERPPEKELAKLMPPEEGTTDLLGIEVETLEASVAKEKGYAEDLKGVIVTKVVTGSPAENANIQVDDVISEVEDTKIATAEEFQAALNAVQEEMVKEKDDERSVLMYVHSANAKLPRRFVAPLIQLPKE